MAIVDGEICKTEATTRMLVMWRTNGGKVIESTQQSKNAVQNSAELETCSTGKCLFFRNWKGYPEKKNMRIVETPRLKFKDERD